MPALMIALGIVTVFFSGVAPSAIGGDNEHAAQNDHTRSLETLEYTMKGYFNDNVRC